jgi:transposase InsO family protein
MPWKTISLLKARRQLVEAVLARRHTIRVLCTHFGVSRKTAYKWLKRFRRHGLSALRDQSRRPCRSPNRLPAHWLRAVQQARRARPHWGAKKIHQQLRRKHPRQRLPSIRTLHRWLKRLGWMRPRPKRARRGPVLLHPGLTRARRSNQVWTVDFKGWFRTADGVRQEPLTVRDLFSRYGLCLRLLPNQDDGPVRRAMQQLFHQHGLPEVIRVDNGSPFSGKGALGLSRLSVWWLRLGIRVEFTRRARPGDNAAHEQFHGCYQREVVNEGGPHRRSMQSRSTRWLADYNHQRPHEALGQRTPAQVYRPSQRANSKTLPPLAYPQRWAIRQVRNRGHIKWRGRLRFVGRAFVGQPVGLQTLSPEVQAVHLGKLLLGHLHDHDTGGMRPARWRRLQDRLKM